MGLQSLNFVDENGLTVVVLGLTEVLILSEVIS